MSDLTLEQKALLEPFGQIFAGMSRRVRHMSDTELQDMLQACYLASFTNCWACSFDAAQYLLRELRREQNQRKQHARAAAVPPADHQEDAT